MKKKKFGPQVDNAGMAVICSGNAWTESRFYLGLSVALQTNRVILRATSSSWRFLLFPELEMETWKELFFEVCGQLVSCTLISFSVRHSCRDREYRAVQILV